MADPVVLYEVDDKVSVITLNRPDKLNAISAGIAASLHDAFRRADDEPATSVVLLRADGPQLLRRLRYRRQGAGRHDDWRSDPVKAHEHLAAQLDFEMMPWNMKKPVIASVQGHVMGGGCELVMLCDLTIAADNAGLWRTRSALFERRPGDRDAGDHRLQKGARAPLFRRRDRRRRPHCELGMVNRVVPLAELPGRASSWAKRLALISPEALYATKRASTAAPTPPASRTALYAGLDVVGPALCDQDRIRRQVPRHRRRRGRPRRGPLARRPIQGITPREDLGANPSRRPPRGLLRARTPWYQRLRLMPRSSTGRVSKHVRRLSWRHGSGHAEERPEDASRSTYRGRATPSVQWLQRTEDGRQQFGHGRVDVHRALHDRVGCFGVHQVEDRVHRLVAAGAEQRRRRGSLCCRRRPGCL